MNFAQVLLPALALTVAANAALASEWEQVDEEGAFTAFVREVEGSSLKSFKGEGVIDAPVNQLLWVLVDNSHRTDWVDRLYETRELARISEPEFVVYNAYKLPAFISNRDYVFQGKAVTETDGAITLNLWSVEHPDSPETIGVRANLNMSRYHLKPMKEGKTFVTVEIHTDPKGLLPSWLVNMIQKSWPIKTLSGLANQVTKDFVKTYPLPPLRDGRAVPKMRGVKTTTTSTAS